MPKSTKNKTTQPRSVSDEITMADRAYAGYLSGRLAGAVPLDSSVRTELVRRFCGPRPSTVEKYTFLFGLRDSGCPLMDPETLLSAVSVSLQMQDVLGVPS